MIVLYEDQPPEPADPWEHDPPPLVYAPWEHEPPDESPPLPSESERAARTWEADRLMMGEP